VDDNDRRENILRLEDRWSMSVTFRLLLLFIGILLTCVSFMILQSEPRV
jgi:hypothetical protein